ncbi:MAG: phage holin family protein [Burkholderiales bacterium]
MWYDVLNFIFHWCFLTLALWLASVVFHGVVFTSAKALWISALLLGFANAVVKPFLILFTLPITVVTFGLFLLVINALMLLLVSNLVKGFKLSGFWTALFASVFISLLSFAIELASSGGVSIITPAPSGHGIMV